MCKGKRAKNVSDERHRHIRAISYLVVSVKTIDCIV